METTNTPQSPPADMDEAAGTKASGKLKRRRQGRNTACQACSNLKMKVCVAQDNGKCERCHRVDRECVPAIPKARKRQTLEGGLPDGAVNQSIATPSRPSLFDPPSSKATSVQPTDTSALVLRHDLSNTGSKTFFSLFSRGLGSSPAYEDLLKGVDYKFVANSFTVFQQLTPYFPFVELSPAADVVAMVAYRPIMTLAVCTVASASSPTTQDRLSQAFLYCLSLKAILSDESSLDLLTGLLVYLAWQHHYLSQQHTYQKLCLLAGIAGDLGLYQAGFSTTDSPGSNLERDRAFVGCYYLCSTLCATGYDKPNPLRWTDNLRPAAVNASRIGALPSDQELTASLELTRALDEFSEIVNEHNGEVATSTHSMELHTKSTLHRVKALKREYPSLASSLGYAAVNLHIYQRLLRLHPTLDSSTLIQCACAVKEYADELLSRPASTLHRIAIVDWTNFLEILLLMAKVSKPSTGGWEAGALTSMLQPETVLDALCSHMASAPAKDPLSFRHEGLLQRFREVGEGIKRLFLHDADVSGEVAGRQSLSFDSLTYFGNGVLDPRFWSSLRSGY
ncbi:uncharacterized protein RCC_08363 [Ramularia collo-cygni]|uniref:Zn(2)-C6 fungal-type domain-containing protein n=1 Tax=Ramularia collo-cygni TaxID=112498 RepID=A0A2D3VM71_9PEZI|nr:uncharacterized protein RCC_08363 [Ramularia collo-cygni]CZT22658.1 uncharacterized protein RCC_08363 [Ramularia collo-cygni]